MLGSRSPLSGLFPRLAGVLGPWGASLGVPGVLAVRQGVHLPETGEGRTADMGAEEGRWGAGSPGGSWEGG